MNDVLLTTETESLVVVEPVGDTLMVGEQQVIVVDNEINELLETEVQVTESIVISNDEAQTLYVNDQDTLTISEELTELLETIEQGVPGPQGQPGTAGVQTLTYQAAADISGHRAIKVLDGLASYASSDEIGDANIIIGISQNAALMGGLVNIQYSGEITEPSWGWISNKPIFCGVGGVLTQTPPAGLQTVVAIAISPTKVIVSIKQPVVTI